MQQPEDGYWPAAGCPSRNPPFDYSAWSGKRADRVRPRVEVLERQLCGIRNCSGAFDFHGSCAASCSGRPPQENPQFNLLRLALRHPSQCLHMRVSDDSLPVALFLSMCVRDI